jgi:RNA polymerase sigma-70 factor (ECF subfamily)
MNMNSPLPGGAGPGSSDAASAESDHALVSRLRAGDHGAFETLMRRYNQRLYRLARSILKNDGEAEDVVQQAYLSAFAHLKEFRGEARFGTWLTRIAINEALARARLNGRTELLDDVASRAVQEDRQSPEDYAAMKEIRLLLESAITSLPESYRVPFMLRDIEGLDTSEAAACLDISEEALRVRLFRARSMLREVLYAEVGAHGTEVFHFAGERCDRIVAGVLAQLEE